MCIESIFDQFWWPSYLTSNLTSIYVNLIKSIYYFLWTSSIGQIFDIWHLFGNLTSFWQLDNYLNLNHLSPSQGYFLLLILAPQDLECCMPTLFRKNCRCSIFCFNLPPHISTIRLWCPVQWQHIFQLSSSVSFIAEGTETNKNGWKDSLQQVKNSPLYC